MFFASNYRFPLIIRWSQFSNNTHSPEQADYPNELKFGMHVPMGEIRGLIEAIWINALEADKLGFSWFLPPHPLKLCKPHFLAS